LQQIVKKMRIFLKKPDNRHCRVDNDPHSIFSNSEGISDEETDIRYKKGYIKGKEEGTTGGKKYAEDFLNKKYEKAYKKIDDSVKRLEDIHQGYLKMVNALQAELPKLINAILERLIARELGKDDGTIIKNIIKEMSKRINSDFVIHVSEHDKKYLESNSSVKIKTDKTLKLGDVILDWKYGQVDGRIETKIRNIEDWINGIDLEHFIKKN